MFLSALFNDSCKLSSYAGDVLEQMYDFLRVNCEVLFVEASPTKLMGVVRKEFLEIVIDNYQGLKEVQSLFALCNLIRWNSLLAFAGTIQNDLRYVWIVKNIHRTV